jgi:hypothetical protein
MLADIREDEANDDINASLDKTGALVTAVIGGLGDEDGKEEEKLSELVLSDYV